MVTLRVKTEKKNNELKGKYFSWTNERIAVVGKTITPKYGKASIF